MNTNSTRYERYERSSTPVDTATMKRTSHRTAKRQGFKALRPQRLAGGRLHRDRSQDLGNHCGVDRKSTRLNSSHTVSSYAVFCLKKKTRRRQSRCKKLWPTAQLSAFP